MNDAIEHITPDVALSALLQPLVKQIAGEVARHMASNAVAATLAQDKAALKCALSIKPFYTAKELAARWNFSKTDTIYEIPTFELPRRKVGSGRGKTLFYCLDVLVYEQTLTREEADALQRSMFEGMAGDRQRHKFHRLSHS